MPRNLRSFAVLRRHFNQRESSKQFGRLRLSQDDTNLAFVWAIEDGYESRSPL
jgi:hypothetical protein